MEIGFAKRDITPAPGVFLAGNGEYQSVRVNDPLFVRAVVFRDGPAWAALVSCDLIGLDPEMSESVRLRLRELRVGQPANLLVSCTHTHNGPHTRLSLEMFRRHVDEAYLERIRTAIVEVVVEADCSLRHAVMKAARGLAFENFNRCLVTPDGVSHFYNPPTLRSHPEYERLVGGVTDNELDALQFLDPNGRPLLTMVHYAAHPLTVGMYEHAVSADYCGRLIDLLETHYGAPAVFFQGACGDLHCKGLFAGYARRDEMAANLAAEAIRVLDNPGVVTCPSPDLRLTGKRVPLPVDIERRDREGWNKAIFTPGFEVEMMAVALGPVAFCSAPGEICCELGLQIKWNSPFPQTWILYYCNNCAAYLAPRRAYREGGYEAETNCLQPEAGEKAVEASIGFCRALWREV